MKQPQTSIWMRIHEIICYSIYTDGHEGYHYVYSAVGCKSIHPPMEFALRYIYVNYNSLEKNYIINTILG